MENTANRPLKVGDRIITKKGNSPGTVTEILSPTIIKVKWMFDKKSKPYPADKVIHQVDSTPEGRTARPSRRAVTEETPTADAAANRTEPGSKEDSPTDNRRLLFTGSEKKATGRKQPTKHEPLMTKRSILSPDNDVDNDVDDDDNTESSSSNSNISKPTKNTKGRSKSPKPRNSTKRRSKSKSKSSIEKEIGDYNIPGKQTELPSQKRERKKPELYIPITITTPVAASTTAHAALAAKAPAPAPAKSSRTKSKPRSKITGLWQNPSSKPSPKKKKRSSKVRSKKKGSSNLKRRRRATGPRQVEDEKTQLERHKIMLEFFFIDISDLKKNKKLFLQTTEKVAYLRERLGKTQVTNISNEIALWGKKYTMEELRSKLDTVQKRLDKINSENIPTLVTGIFPVKLHHIASHAKDFGVDNIISWSGGGETVTIHNRQKFATSVLEKHKGLGGKDWHSFKGILSRWGFVFENKAYDSYVIFSHPLFTLKNPEACLRMEYINKYVSPKRKLPSTDTSPQKRPRKALREHRDEYLLTYKKHGVTRYACVRVDECSKSLKIHEKLMQFIFQEMMCCIQHNEVDYFLPEGFEKCNHNAVEVIDGCSTKSLSWAMDTCQWEHFIRYYKSQYEKYVANTFLRIISEGSGCISQIPSTKKRRIQIIIGFCKIILNVCYRIKSKQCDEYRHLSKLTEDDIQASKDFVVSLGDLKEKLRELNLRLKKAPFDDDYIELLQRLFPDFDPKDTTVNDIYEIYGSLEDAIFNEVELEYLTWLFAMDEEESQQIVDTYDRLFEDKTGLVGFVYSIMDKHMRTRFLKQTSGVERERVKACLASNAFQMIAKARQFGSRSLDYTREHCYDPEQYPTRRR